MDFTSKFTLIEGFCSKHLADKKYLRHSDLDLYLNVRLTALYNFMNLLKEENKQIFLLNQNKNNKYYTEIESEKNSIIEERRKLVEEYSQKKNFSIKNLSEIREDSILNFSIPEFELYFSVKLVVNGIPIEPECITDLILNKNFNEHIIIRYKYKDLTPDSYLLITIHSMQFPNDDSSGDVLGYTKINLFDENFNLLQGKHAYKIYLKAEKDKILSANNLSNMTNPTTNSHVKRNSVFNNLNNQTSSNLKFEDENLKEVDYLINSFENSNLFSKVNNPSNYSYIYNVNPAIAPCNFESFKSFENYLLTTNANTNLSKEAYDFAMNFSEKLQLLLSKTDSSYIEISLQKFNVPVIYEEEKSLVYKQFYKNMQIKDGNGSTIKIDNLIRDPEMRKGKNFTSKDNPITEKFSILSRITDDSVARDIRPGPADTQRITELLNTPDFIKLEDSDIILFWRYRYYLLERQIGLTKILNAVKWGDNKSENEFIQNILNKWTKIEMCDILYMLSYKFCMNSYYTKTIHAKMNEVRNFAVKNLEKFESNELNFILLQLVQALRYEDEKDSQLKQFLLMRCSKEIELATSLYWFLAVEADDSDVKSLSKANRESANLLVQFYKNIFYQFENSLTEDISEVLNSQKNLRDKLIRMSNELEKKKNENEKRRRLIEIINKNQEQFEMNKFPPISLPINPKIKINGTIAEGCRVFKSAKYPVKYSFKVTNESQEHIRSDDPSIFEIMFKYGDDLRQDQLILQIISYMDLIFKNVHLDFNFTTYKVLATSKTDGFVEFVANCRTIQDILANNGNQISPYLREISNNFDKTLDYFISSCAGYCVVTYILGIGDRHLENLLINNAGKLFHIDFGFILGKDPKPFPPPVKLCMQMVEAMGGKNSAQYEVFKKKCVDAYLCLRTNARLIVNMFYLMIHSGINQLTENSEIALNKLHEKFVPNFNPQEASNSILSKLEESVNAFFPTVLEKIHVWANYFK